MYFKNPNQHGFKVLAFNARPISNDKLAKVATGHYVMDATDDGME